MSRTSLIFRSLFLLGFVLAMPLLALPTVARWADEVLYGDAAADSADRVLAKPDKDSPTQEQREVVQAVLEAPLPGASQSQPSASPSRGLDSVTAHPPALAPRPEFPLPATEPDRPNPDPVGPLRSSPTGEEGAPATWPKRLGEIRQRLEDLGAESVRLEIEEQTGHYHFQCNMLVAPQELKTQLFEATGKDATTVAEQILEAVERWRAGQASRSP